MSISRKSIKFDENIKRVVFDKIMLNLTHVHHIPKDHLNGWNMDVVLRDIEYGAASELAFNLRNFIVHGKKEINYSALVPINWWEAFKDEVIYSNKRWYKKYPKVYFYIAKFFGRVKHKVIETSTVYMRYCPHVESPNSSCHLEFLQFNDVPNFFGHFDNETIK